MSNVTLPPELVAFEHDLEDAITRDQSRARRRRRVVRVAVPVVLAAAILSGSLGLLSDGAPSALSQADAAILHRAAAALTAPAQTIVHEIEQMTVRGRRDHASRIVARRESWLLQRPGEPCDLRRGCPFLAYRMVSERIGYPRWESSTDSTGLTDIFDARTNTIYIAKRRWSVFPQMATFPVILSQIDPSSPGFARELKALITGGHAHVLGYRKIDGEQAIAMSGTVSGASPELVGDWTYYVAVASYRPIALQVRTRTSDSLTIRFLSYATLPSAGHMDVFNLADQHPGARIVRGESAYVAAATQLDTPLQQAAPQGH